MASMLTSSVSGYRFTGISHPQRSRLSLALKPALSVYLYEQPTWTSPAILLGVWLFGIIRKAA